jgi:membrane protease YdiL (CAAX protease family)
MNTESQGPAARPWLLFASQQALLFVSALAFLHLVRRLTGHTLHGMQDRIGPLEALAVLLLYAAHLLLTVAMYRRARRGAAQPLGIGLSLRRAVDFMVGMLLAFALCAWPWLIGLARGSARVTQSVWTLPTPIDGWQVCFWLMLGLIVNSIVEETTNRAFPMRLWSERSLWFRLIVPSLVFAALHLADEPFEAHAFATRTLAGVTLSLAYAATGNIWLAAGVHAGMNYSSLWHAGLWHAGSWVALAGRPLVHEDAGELGLALFTVAAYALSHARAPQRGSAPASLP